MLYLFAHYLLTPWLTFRNAIVNLVKLTIPTQVFYVAHINPDTQGVTIIHEPSSYWSRDQNTIGQLTSKDRESGFYYIRTWDGLLRTPREYFLSASHLRTALGLTNLASWWAMHDYGIQVLLSSHMAYHKNNIDSGALFAMYDNTGEDLSYYVHHKLISSLEIKNNITAKACTILLQHLGHLSSDHHVQKLVDFDLEERILEPDEFLFAYKK